MAVKKYLIDIDLAKNSLNNARVQNLAADPGSPVAGQVYYNTVSNKLRTFNGTTWDEMGTSTSAVTSVAGRTGVVVLTSADVGLANVDNTSDINKPVSTAQATSIATKEPTITAGTTAQYYRGDKSMQTLNQDAVPSGTTNKAYTVTEQTKLAGIATAATANSSDAVLEARANHTGTQLAATISDFSTAADARITAAAGTSIATLSAGKVPTSQLPAISLTSVQTAINQAAQLALTTQEGDVVVRTDTNTTYMKNAGVAGTMADFTLLNTPTDAVTSVNSQTGVVVLAKTDVGLGNVDNTSDTSKPVSTAQATVIALKANIASPTFTGTVAGITSTMVGLGSVDNTSDVSKPVSTAQATAIALKLAIASNLSDVANAATAFGNIKQAGTTGATGVLQLATQAEAQAKADTAKALTAASVADFARKNTGLMGNASLTSIPITHGLGSQFVMAQVFDATSNSLVECDVVQTSATVTTFNFNIAPTLNQYRYVIIG